MPPSAVEPSAATTRRVPRGLGWLAVALAAGWPAALAALAVWASNPVLLNRKQVLDARRAGVIVEARVVDAASGECAVLRQWPTATVGETVRVHNLSGTPAVTGETYLLPLLRADNGGWDIAPTPLPDSRALIYPATTETVAQLERLLAG